MLVVTHHTRFENLNYYCSSFCSSVSSSTWPSGRKSTVFQSQPDSDRRVSRSHGDSEYRHAESDWKLVSIAARVGDRSRQVQNIQVPRRRSTRCSGIQLPIRLPIRPLDKEIQEGSREESQGETPAGSITVRYGLRRDSTVSLKGDYHSREDNNSRENNNSRGESRHINNSNFHNNSNFLSRLAIYIPEVALAVRLWKDASFRQWCGKWFRWCRWSVWGAFWRFSWWYKRP
jgi:hypothetical protein